MKKSRAVGLLALSGLAVCAAAWAAPCANPCVTPQVNVVYFGATAVNNTINDAAVSLYGDPLKTCTSTVKTYQCMRDLDGTPGVETCVRAYVAENKGSCEGVQALDRKESTFNVCDPTGPGGTAGIRSLAGLLDESGHQLYANFIGSDVSYTLCEPVVTGAQIQRPTMFDDTEDQAFVTPFALIANRALENVLPSRAKNVPASCPFGAGDCVQLDVSLTKDQLKDIFGFNNLCDWRFVSNDVDASVPRNIGTVMRNRQSGTRRNFNVTFLQGLAPGQGNDYIASTSNMITRVSNNQWCATNASECGENQSTGATGGGSVSAACSGQNNISLGYIGTDRLNIHDNGTPANPHDDFGYRLSAADSYTPLKYNGAAFNKANVQCGKYEYWSIERLYYDNDPNPAINGLPGYFFPPGSIREKAVQEWRNQTSTNAVNDPTVVSLGEMFFGRAVDGGPPFPKTPLVYNSFCAEP